MLLAIATKWNSDASYSPYTMATKLPHPLLTRSISIKIARLISEYLEIRSAFSKSSFSIGNRGQCEQSLARAQ